MRTTVTLDPDVEALIRDRMSRKGVSFKRALNDAIRAGAGEAAAYQTPVFDLGVPAVDLTKALRIAAELEDEALTAKVRRGA